MGAVHSSRCEVENVPGKRLGVGSRVDGIPHSSGERERMLESNEYLFILGVVEFSSSCLFNYLSCEKKS
jgi:hypothetical protein